jgi:hypothetical protein
MPGGITLIEATPASIPTPAAGKDTIFIDSTAIPPVPSYKNSAGAVAPLGTNGATGAAGPIGPVIMGLDGSDGEPGIIINQVVTNSAFNTVIPAAGGTQSVTSSTVLVNDNVLLFPVISGAVYVIEGVIWFTSGTLNTVDAKFAFTFPGTLSVLFAPFYQVGGTVTTSLDMFTFDASVASGTAGSIGVLSTATVFASPINFKGVFRANANGTFQFQFAQNTSSATPLVRQADSWLRYSRVS